MGPEHVVAIIAALIGAGGIWGGIAAFRKVQPEKESIIVTAAQGVVVMQAGVLEDLREELTRALGRIDELEDELHRETDRLRTERDGLRSENTKLRERVRTLEARVEQLEASPPAV